MSSVHSNDTDTVNNLRGTFPPLLVESLTVTSYSEAGITRLVIELRSEATPPYSNLHHFTDYMVTSSIKHGENYMMSESLVSSMAAEVWPCTRGCILWKFASVVGGDYV